MLAAAVVPHPPLLVPAVAAGTAPEAAPVLHACDGAVAALLAEAPEVVVCVGPGVTTRRHPPGAWGTLGGFGAQVPAPGSHHVGRAHLPLSLTLGRWLLDRAEWEGRVLVQEIAAGATPQECQATGRRLAAQVTEISTQACWLVLGDGGTLRGERSSGPDDDQEARTYDNTIEALFAAGDAAGIADLDAASALAAGAGGQGAWQVLAAAVLESGNPVRSAVTYSGAPFGVGYLVATWWLEP